ncbi:Uncharacterized protein DAT39_014873, partial [Clarias magur]
MRRSDWNCGVTRRRDWRQFLFSLLVRPACRSLTTRWRRSARFPKGKGSRDGSRDRPYINTPSAINEESDSRSG